MKISNIKNVDRNYLDRIGFKENQISLIYDLIGKVIGIYSKIHYPYHNIEHIERVVCYCVWIMNKKISNGEVIENSEVLLNAALYHDCGRNLTVSNKTHGIVGAQIAKDILKDNFNNKELSMIELLIETHAQSNDKVDFKNYEFTEMEKENIQYLSNILKDADALDRNRTKLFKFAQCNPVYLRTNEAKEIFDVSYAFLRKYEEAKKK